MNGRDLTLFERAPRGGADTWDLGPAGQILTEELFGAPPAPPSGLQAVRFDADADVLVMPAAAVPSGSGAWTVAVWLRLSADRNVPTMLWSFDGIFSSSWHALETDSSGTSLRVYETGTTAATIATLSIGVWYFVVVRKTVGGTIKTYIGDEAFGALSTAAGSVTNLTYAGDGYVGGSAYGDHLDGRMWGMRVWDAELSDAEIDAEFASATGAAVRTTNRRAEWLLDDDVTPGTDSSGNGRTLTNTGGAWALETGPTFPAGGGTVTAAIAGTLAGPTSNVGANQVVAGLTGTIAGPTSAVGAVHGVGATLAGTVPAPVSAVAAAHGVAVTLAGTLAGPTSAVDVTVNSSLVTATLAGTIPGPTSAVGAAHGVAGSVAGTLAGPTSSIAAVRGAGASLAGTLAGPTSSSTAAHGVNAAAAGTIPVTSSAAASHGAAGALAGVLSISSSVSAAHGASAAIAGVIPAPTSAIDVSGVAEVLATPVVVLVSAERRVLFEVPDVRRLEPQGERRALYEPAEDRTLNVAPERRTLWESP